MVADTSPPSSVTRPFGSVNFQHDRPAVHLLAADSRNDCPAADFLPEYVHGWQKRSLDVVVASILLMLSLPVFLGLALAIKLTSRGPVFFVQERYGKDLRTFNLLKFRSMYSEYSTEACWKQASRGDPRVTPLGRFIRKTSLDELPQLLNVLWGEMSLVGPRPHPIPLDRHFSTLIAGYFGRYAGRPGVTGLAQVNGARGETPTLGHMVRRVIYDIQYIETASLTIDLKILARTTGEVF